MPTPVTTRFASPAPGDAPTTFIELVALLNALVASEVESDFQAFVVGASTPSVDDQDKIWFRTDGAGRPLGPHQYYGGSWRKVYRGQPSQIVMYGGATTPFDGAGKGTVGGDWDGWAICNGQNGTPNLSDKFIVGASMDNAGATGYSGGNWRSDVSGAPLQTGGVKDITLTDANTYQRATPEIKAWLWEADGNNGRTGGNLYGTPSTPGQSVTLQSVDAGNTTPPAIPTLPPYYVLAFVMWIGYA